MSNVIHVSVADFEEKVLKSTKPVIVDFWAEWCGPCKAIAPILDEVSVEKENVIIAKVDVDKNQELAQKYGIRGIPTMKLFKNGKEEASKVGMVTKQGLNAWLDTNLD